MPHVSLCIVVTFSIKSARVLEEAAGLGSTPSKEACTYTECTSRRDARVLAKVCVYTQKVKLATREAGERHENNVISPP